MSQAGKSEAPKTDVIAKVTHTGLDPKAAEKKLALSGPSASSSATAPSTASASASTAAATTPAPVTATATPAVLGLDDLAADDDMIELVSKEQRKFKVSKKAAIASTLVKTAIENDKDAKEVTLVHIETAIVQKVVDYMNHHTTVPPRKIEKPLKSTNLRELVDDFDAKFVDTIDQETMFKLLLAANYMDIKSLLLLMCAKVASLMKGKTPDQIRKTFNIRSDYTPEEEEEVRKEHRDLIE